MKTRLRLLPLIVLLLAGPAGAAAPLELQIVHRPPYLIVQPDGQLGGIAAKPALAAFKDAGIAVTWREVPALRQLHRLKENQERICSVGWYKTWEREQFAKFTDPVSQDGPYVAFANDGLRMPAKPTVHAVLADARTTVLIKSGFVYGDFLDREIAQMKAQRKETRADMPQLLTMVELGRAQITFAPIEELDYYYANRTAATRGGRIVRFDEMPSGYKRHLMCSKRVEDAVIARFNAALAKLKG